MLSNKERLFITDQFANNKYCRSEDQLLTECRDSSFLFFTSRESENKSNCGDYISFAVKKNEKMIEEVLFFREEACIVVISATNIICEWINEKGKNLDKVAMLLHNVERMVNSENYEFEECKKIEVFSNLKYFAVKKACLMLVVENFSRIIAG